MNVLLRFRFKTQYPDKPHHTSIWSQANGDVKMDIAAAQAFLQQGQADFAVTCLKVYGLAHLLGYDVHGLPTYDPLAYPMIIDDEDMLCILNARGTVVLNTLFAHAPEQKAIVKLAEAALHLFKMWAATNPSDAVSQDRCDLEVCESTCTVFCYLLTKPQYQRFKKMILVIREDIQTHMLNYLGRMEWSTQVHYARPISVLKDKIDAWRFLALRRVDDDTRYERPHTNAKDLRWMQCRPTWQSFARWVEDYMRTLDVSWLDDLPGQHNLDLPVQRGLEFMGPMMLISRDMNDPYFANYQPGIVLRFPGLKRTPDGIWLKC